MMASDRLRASAQRGRGWLGRFVALGTGAMVGREGLRRILDAPAARLLGRTNFRGRPVSLAGGTALVMGATAGAVAGAAVGGHSARLAAAVSVAGLGSGLVGVYDDVVGARPDQRSVKGFHGHLAALRRGQVTTGMVKIAGVGAAGLAAASLLAGATGRRRGAVDIVLDAGVIAGTANLINLLDLRPGRALKAALLVAGPLAAGGGPTGPIAAGVAGAAAALLPRDLHEETMLGDGGANALGALIGTVVAARTGRWGRAAVLAGIVGLTAASEKVSFTRVIAATPVLRELDGLGRWDG